MDFDFNPEKFKDLVVYFAKLNRSSGKFGATKLNKLLYYTDFEAYRRWGEPITGAHYTHLQEGPVPVEMLGIPRGRQKFSSLSDQEKALAEEVLERFHDYNAQQISTYSHKEPGWLLTARGEMIPYHTAWLAQKRKLTSSEIEMAKRIAEEIGGSVLI